MMDCDILSK